MLKVTGRGDACIHKYKPQGIFNHGLRLALARENLDIDLFGVADHQQGEAVAWGGERIYQGRTHCVRPLDLQRKNAPEILSPGFLPGVGDRIRILGVQLGSG